MHPNPLEALQRMTEAEASRREAARAENRRRFPELAAVTDTLPAGHWKLLCVWDAHGNVVMGKPPEPRPGDAIAARWATERKERRT